MQSDVYELRQHWSISQVAAQTTIHIAVDETGATNTLFRAQAVELAWFDHFGLAWFFSLPRDVTYRRVVCRRINNGGGPAYRNTRLTPGNPGNPESHVACQCTGVVSQSFNAGSWISTRLRFPGSPVGGSAPNRVSHPVSIQMAAIGELLLSSWNYAGVTYEAVAWSRKSRTWSHFVSTRPINFWQPLKSRRPGILRRTRW
jgi:hypothetical protein